MSCGLVACGDGPGDSGNNQLSSCESHDDCSNGERCSVAGTCHAAGSSCEFDPQCQTGAEYCSKDSSASTDGTCLGNWCSGDEDCPGHAICQGDRCRTGCRDNSECGGGEICDTVELRCKTEDECQTAGDCPGGHKTCDTSGEANKCRPDGTCSRQVHCTSYANDIGADEVYICNEDGECIPEPPCESDDACDPGEICDEGTCRAGCRDDDGCFSGEYCDLETETCVSGCNTNADCEGDSVCVDLECRTACDRRDDCPTGLICTGDPSHCQTCDDDNQCHALEFCNFEETPDPETGKCDDLPPECPDDPFGENHVQANAHDLSGESFPFEAVDDSATEDEEGPVFCRENDVEWYRLMAQPGEVVDVEIEYDANLGNLDLFLVNSAGTILRSSDRPPDRDPGVERLQYGVDPNLGSAQELFIQLGGTILESKVRYRLNVDVRDPLTCGDDGFEPNNTKDDAESLAEGTTHTDLEVCGGDSDFYTISVEANQIVTIDLFTEERLGKVNIFLDAGDGSFVPNRDSNSSDLHHIYHYGTQQAGDIIIEIELDDGAGRAMYDLKWSRIDNQCTDPLETNDTCPGDVALLNPNHTSGSFSDTHSNLNVCSDEDYYAVNLRPLDELTVTAVYDPRNAAGTLQLSLFGPNDCALDPRSAHEEELGSGEYELKIADNNDSTQPFVAQEGGTYYILASRFSGLRVPYSLDVEIEPGPPCTDDSYDDNASNDTYTDAVAIDPDQVVNNGPESALLGLRICDYNEDWYKITLADGDVLEWEIRHDKLDGEIDASLIDSNGSTVLDSIDPQGYVSVTNNSGGDKTYYLKVVGANDLPVRNTYRLLTSVNYSGPSDKNCPDTFENNDSSAAPVDLAAGTYTNLLACGGDADWYRTFVQAGETITVDTTENSNGTIYLHLYEDSDLNTPKDGQTSGSDTKQLTYTSARDQFVYYRVTTASSGTEDTPYEIDVSVSAATSCTDDGFAGNTDSTSAEPVGVPGLFSRLMKCEDTSDWFEVDLTDGQLFEAYLNYDDALAGLEVEIYEPSDLISAAASGTGSAQYTPSVNGTHYVRVHSPTRARVPYDLLLYRDYSDDNTIDLDGTEGPADRDCPDVYENNDTASAATELPAGSYSELLACSGSPIDDKDFYEVWVPSGATLSVDLFFTHADGNIELFVTDGDGNSFNSRTSTDDESVSQTNNSSIGQTYTVEVRGAGNFQSYYSMDLGLAFGNACSEDQFDPANDAQSGAASITADTYELTLCENTEDWFTFDLANGEDVEVNIELRHRLGDLDVELYDSTNSVVDSSTTTGNIEEFVHTNTTGSTETYELRVFPKDGAFMRNSYDLWLSLGSNFPSTPFCADDYERNDDTESSHKLEFASEPQIPDAIMCSTEEDWYQVELSTGVTYDLAAFFDHSTDFDLALEVRDENGTPLADGNGDDIEFGTHSATDDEFASFTAPSTGTYFVGVKQQGADATIQGDYFIHFDDASAACPQDTYEPNDSFGNAEPLTDAGVYALGMCSDSIDWFDYTAASDGSVTFTVYYDESDISLTGYVNAPGNAFDTSGTNRATVTLSATQGDTFYVYLESTSGTGPYFLKIDE